MSGKEARFIMPPEYAALTPVPPDKNDSPPQFQNRHFWFTKTFFCEDPHAEYRVKITADDYYVLYVNDRLVCQGPAPSYLFRYAWNETALTGLRQGENRIAVHVYSQGLFNWVWESADLRCALFVQIERDGETVCATDERWLCAPDRRYLGLRHIGYRTQFLEDYDCRIPLGEAEHAAVIEHPAYTLDTEAAPLIRCENRTPVRAWTLPPDPDLRPRGGVLYDFGSEIAAHVCLTLTGHAGEQILLLCGEELLRDGDPMGGVRWDMRCYCPYRETVTLAEGESRIRQYDYKGFRYVEVQPLAGDPHWEVSADVRTNPYHLRPRVRLETNDERLAAIFGICAESIHVGVQEVFMDCPQREKGQYAGDLTVSSHAQLWLSQNAAMLRRAITASLDSARYFPGLRAVAPGAASNCIADYSLQLPILLMRYYDFTRDAEFLRAAMPTVTGVFDYFRSFANADGLLENVDTMWNLVDWPENLRDGYDFILEPKPEAGPHCVLNAFWAGGLAGYEELCELTGTPYEKTAERVKDAFNRAFFDEEAGCYRDSTKTRHSACQSNCLPLYYRLCPAEQEERLARRVAETGLRCGVYMAYFLLMGLCRAGHYDDAYRLMTSDGAWYNMVREGATTCMEAWGKDQKDNTSFCHPWASAPVPLVIEEFLGYRLNGERAPTHLPAGVTAKLHFLP